MTEPQNNENHTPGERPEQRSMDGYSASSGNSATPANQAQSNNAAMNQSGQPENKRDLGAGVGPEPAPGPAPGTGPGPSSGSGLSSGPSSSSSLGPSSNSAPESSQSPVSDPVSGPGPGPDPLQLAQNPDHFFEGVQMAPFSQRPVGSATSQQAQQAQHANLALQSPQTPQSPQPPTSPQTHTETQSQAHSQSRAQSQSHPGNSPSGFFDEPSANNRNNQQFSPRVQSPLNAPGTVEHSGSIAPGQNKPRIDKSASLYSFDNFQSNTQNTPPKPRVPGGFFDEPETPARPQQYSSAQGQGQGLGPGQGPGQGQGPVQAPGLIQGPNQGQVPGLAPGQIPAQGPGMGYGQTPNNPAVFPDFQQRQPASNNQGRNYSPEQSHSSGAQHSPQPNQNRYPDNSSATSPRGVSRENENPAEMTGRRRGPLLGHEGYHDSQQRPVSDSNRSNQSNQRSGRGRAFDSSSDSESETEYNNDYESEYDSEYDSESESYSDSRRGSKISGGKKKRKRRDDNTDITTDKNESSNRFSHLDKLAAPDTSGLFMFCLYQAKLVLTNPKEFFAGMEQNGNFAEPILFLAICSAASGLLAGILSFNLLVTFQFFLGSFIFTILIAVGVSKLLTYYGGKGSFEATMRVICYSQASLLVAGLKVGALGYITLLIATIYGIYLQTLGMDVIHKVDKQKTILVLAGVTALAFLIRWKVNLL